MTEQDIKNKNLVLIDCLRSIINGYKIVAEYNTNDNNVQVIVVQETSGQKIVLWDTTPLYNYYDVNIYGDNIQNAKETSVDIGNLIGKNIYFEWKEQKWQIMFKQFANPRAIAYEDIRRVAYTSTLQCVINRIS